MSDDPFPIKRCVCFDRTFVELRDSGLSTLEEIAEVYGCSTKCGLCADYIRRMLRTGETEFAVDAEF